VAISRKTATSNKAADHHHKSVATKPLSGSAAVNASKRDGGAEIVKPPPPAPAPIVSNPAPFGGSPWANPFNAAELKFYASLVKNINLPPKYLIPIYRAAARRYHVPWQLLAAINRMETDYGSDLSVSSAGAVGWMQFEPGTWEQYGIAVNRHDKPVRGKGNPYNPRDAIFAAARYLRASGATRNVPRAVFAYNHADWYVVQVLSIAQQVNVHGLRRRSGHNHKIGTMVATARLLNGTPYEWGGGHSSWSISTGYDCSGFVSMVLHSAGFLQSPVTTQTLPYQRWIRPGRGRWVTIYDRTDSAINGDHVIIDLKGQWWESGGSTLAGGGERVHRIKMTKATRRTYLPTFNLVMHPYGL
jgi:cell wall-associated NlpC family hydrolase